MKWPLLAAGAVALGLAGLAAWSWRPRDHQPPPGDLVVDPARYAGLWYEIGRTPNDFQDNTPSRSGQRLSACFATTATYTLRGDGTIAILNRCLRLTPDGDTADEVAQGVAVPVAGSGNRKLKIAFGPPALRAVQRAFLGGGSDYWIFCLGEAPEGEPYPWAVVSGPDRDFLFLLSRTAEPARAVTDAIAACLARAGLPASRVVDRRRPPA